MNGIVSWKLFGLQIEVYSYEFPQIDEFWDANWLSCKACLEVSGAYVECNGPFLRTDEILRFVEQLELLNTLKASQAKLTCLEPNLAISVESEGSLGALRVHIDLTHDALTQKHHFDLNSDLSFLPEIIRGARQILKSYPVKGTANVQ